MEVSGELLPYFGEQYFRSEGRADLRKRVACFFKWDQFKPFPAPPFFLYRGWLSWAPSSFVSTEAGCSVMHELLLRGNQSGFKICLLPICKYLFGVFWLPVLAPRSCSWQLLSPALFWNTVVLRWIKSLCFPTMVISARQYRLVQKGNYLFGYHLHQLSHILVKWDINVQG